MHIPVVLGLDFGGTQDRRRGQRRRTGRGSARPRRTVPTVAPRATFERGIAAARGCWPRSRRGGTLAAVGACHVRHPARRRRRAGPNISGLGRAAVRPGAAPRLPRRRDPAGDRREGGGAGRGSSGRARPAATPGSTSISAPGWPSAIVAGGAVLSGRHGAAGEIGYNLRGPTSAPDAPTACWRTPSAARRSGTAAARLLGRRRRRRRCSPAPDRDPAAAGSRRLRRRARPTTSSTSPSRSTRPGSWSAAGWCVPGTSSRPACAPPSTPRSRSRPSSCRPRFPFDAPLIGALALGIAAARECSTAHARPSSAKERQDEAHRTQSPPPSPCRSGLARRPACSGSTTTPPPRTTAPVRPRQARRAAPTRPRTSRAARSRSPTSQGQTWTCQFNPFNPRSTRCRSASSTSRWSSSTCCRTRRRRRCWRRRYSGAPDKKSIVFTIRDGGEVERRPAVHAPRTSPTPSTCMKRVPGDRPLRAVDRRRPDRASPPPATRSR